MAGTQDPGMGLRSQPAGQGCLQAPPDHVHRNGEVTSIRVAVSAASPAGLGKRICAGRGSDSQSLLPCTPAGAERACGELPKPICPPGLGFPAHAARRGVTTKPPSIARRCWPKRSEMGQISIYRRTARGSGRVEVTPRTPAQPLLIKTARQLKGAAGA